MTRIVLADFRHPTTQVCKNARHWFDRVGLDWRGFVRNGIDADALRASGQHLDLIARLEVVAIAREARNGGR